MRLGELSEWLKVPDSKSGVPQGTGGSNPSLSATKRRTVSRAFTSLAAASVDFISRSSLVPSLALAAVKLAPQLLLQTPAAHPLRRGVRVV